MKWSYDCYLKAHTNTACAIVSVAFAVLAQSAVATTIPPVSVLNAARAGSAQTLQATAGTNIETAEIPESWTSCQQFGLVTAGA